ncbi:AraC family transcriptional regulator [Amycolatopsis rifamycinica]|uniref:AraC family transcriptional regulator n=1 Tax=Amycolatopsis rifamycinica TaxID=287986 RepID=A0A066U3V9_9PSEU|nr:AraC family transcriptional regulator [Amycolatopsis rifamycinica]KDN21760.1 AraC family transcriptional regulator [Amycolatopsis rifamycinica]
MDVLSDVIGAVRTGRPFANREDRRGGWRTDFAAFAGIGFHLVLEGSCRMVTPGAAPLVLQAGDVVLTPRGTAHALTDTGLDDATQLLCGAYQLDRSRLHPLLTDLPEVIHLRARAGGHPTVSAVVGLLGGELTAPGLGADAAIPSLLDLLLLFLLREWLTEEPGRDAAGWCAALTDPAIGTALRCLHDDPLRPWTVEELGARAGLSRAAFSRKFTALVGQPPMAYLTYWRLTLGARLLRETDLPLPSVAQRCGYSSPFAFAAAFKREHGDSPGRYRSRHQADDDIQNWVG